MNTIHNFSAQRREISKIVASRANGQEVYIVRNLCNRFSLYFVGRLPEFATSLREHSMFGALIDELETVDPETEDFIYTDLQQDAEPVGESQVFFVERHLTRTNWFSKPNTPQLKHSKVAAFYSFKGGVGRTTGMVLTALALVRQGKKVMLLDFDWEAPGLGYVLDPEGNYRMMHGTLDLLLAIQAYNGAPEGLRMDDYFFTINRTELVGHEGGELWVMPAAAATEEDNLDYINKLSKVEYRTDGEDQPYGPLQLLQLIDERLAPDYILIDTRTGINDIGGMVFHQLADLLFLFFYGDEQNMMGLRMLLPALKQLSTKDRDLVPIMVNSVVPPDKDLAEDETAFFVEASYQAYSDFYYDQNENYAIKDNDAPHFPVSVEYNANGILLNSFGKLKAMLDSPSSAYHQLAAKFYALEPDAKEERGKEVNQADQNTKLLQAFTGPYFHVVAGESEYETENDLKERFYPQKAHRFIFDPTKFLVLGAKGMGKTALFSVLQHKDFTGNLAQWCGLQPAEAQKTKWVTALDVKGNHPSKSIFNSLSALSGKELSTVWLILLFRALEDSYIDSSWQQVVQARRLALAELSEFVKTPKIDLYLEQALGALDQRLQQEGNRIIFVYDYLDRLLDTEENLRGRLISRLLDVYLQYFPRFSHIRAKIFLRRDIFDREVDLTDKVKLTTYSAPLEWSPVQLFNMVWKRLLVAMPQARETYFGSFLTQLEEPKGLGLVPQLNEEQHRNVLAQMMGARMRNKSHPFTWIVGRVQDAKELIHPRTLLWLFYHSATLAKEDTVARPYALRTGHLADGVKETSVSRITDLKEEYSYLNEVFDKLSASEEIKKLSPMEEESLLKALKELDFKNPDSTVKELIDIGVLYKYKKRKKDDPIRYHIPDLYLYGLGLSRYGAK